MPKTKIVESVSHEWTHVLTFQQQELLATGHRGPDGCNKHNPAKAMVRYSVFKDWQRKFFDDPDGYPHHFIMHLFHCAEVIGYKHPDDFIRHCWHGFYLKAAKSLHMHPETEAEMDARLNDFGVPIPEDDGTLYDTTHQI